MTSACAIDTAPAATPVADQLPAAVHPPGQLLAPVQRPGRGPGPRCQPRRHRRCALHVGDVHRGGHHPQPQPLHPVHQLVSRTSTSALSPVDEVARVQVRDPVEQLFQPVDARHHRVPEGAGQLGHTRHANRHHRQPAGPETGACGQPPKTASDERLARTHSSARKNATLRRARTHTSARKNTHGSARKNARVGARASGVIWWAPAAGLARSRTASPPRPRPPRSPARRPRAPTGCRRTRARPAPR